MTYKVHFNHDFVTISIYYVNLNHLNYDLVRQFQFYISNMTSFRLSFFTSLLFTKACFFLRWRKWISILYFIFSRCFLSIISFKHLVYLRLLVPS